MATRELHRRVGHRAYLGIDTKFITLERSTRGEPRTEFVRLSDIVDKSPASS